MIFGLVFVFGAVTVLLIGLWLQTALRNHNDAQMDVISYAVAKGVGFIVKDPFPLNNTQDIITSRRKTIDTFLLLEPLMFFLNPSLKKIPFQDLKILVDTTDGATVSIRIYNYNSSDSKPKRKVLIYFHGGGWVVGSLIQCHFLALQLAQLTDYVVINADYRLAPEYIFPTAANDAYEVLQWTINNIDQYGGDNSSVVVSGGSVGGNLALAITSKHLIHRAKEICHQSPFIKDSSSLTCPALLEKEKQGERWHEIVGVWASCPTVNGTSPSVHSLKYANLSATLTLQGMEWFRRLYQGSDDINDEIRNHYLFSPINTPQAILDVYPPTMFTLARYDTLAPEAVELFEKLKRSNRGTKIDVYNTVHGFTSFHPKLGDKALKVAVENIKQWSV